MGAIFICATGLSVRTECPIRSTPSGSYRVNVAR
jgi:hypothetical protein